MMWGKFDHFGAPHLTVLALTAGVAILFCASAGRSRTVGKKLRAAEWTLAIVMCLTFPLQIGFALHYGLVSLSNSLPLHLCDVTAYVGAFALITRRAVPTELLYFWGIAMTMQALVTPAGLHHDFPHPGFFVFFVHHGCIVVAAIYVVAGRRNFPRPGSVWRAMLWGQVYFAVAGVANYFLGTNYAFLREKPGSTGSLMDLMGEWPIYLIWMEVAAFIAFVLLYAPFYFWNRRLGRRRRIKD